MPDAVAAAACVAVAFALKELSVRLGWRTAPFEDEPRGGGGEKTGR